MFPRFAQRAGGYELVLTSVQENTFLSSLKPLNYISPDELKDKPRLQLYHVVRDNSHVQSIFKHGFNYTDGNKGGGVYLANHAWYAMYWGGTEYQVIVCDVPLDAVVDRYISEVLGPDPMLFDAEYVVRDSTRVCPRAAFGYQVLGDLLNDPRPTGIRNRHQYLCLKPECIQRWKCNCRKDVLLTDIVEPLQCLSML